MTEHVPYVVVGAGAMGLATTWQLARRGHRVLALERFDRGHSHGASHGATRNFNNAYAAPHYLDLLALARTEWDELARTTGEPLLRLHGLVTHGDEAVVAQVHDALVARGERAEILGAADAGRRWSGMRFDGDVLFTPDAGVVRAAAALEALERGARRVGAGIRFGHRVIALEERGDGVALRIDDGERRYDVVADTAVVTSGAWTPGILPASFPLPRLTVTEESPAHFAPISPDARWPSFNHLDARGTYPGPTYGMPTPGEGVKVGFHHVGPVVDPDRGPSGRRPSSLPRCATTSPSGSPASTPIRPSRSAARTRRRTPRTSCSIAGAASSSARASLAMASSSRRQSARCSPTSRPTTPPEPPRPSGSADRCAAASVRSSGRSGYRL